MCVFFFFAPFVFTLSLTMEENQAVLAATIATPSGTNESAASTYHKGIAPIKAQYLVPKAEVKKEESLAHLSEAIEAQGDEGRAGDDNDGDNNANENNKRDRKDVRVFLVQTKQSPTAPRPL